jgi:hypothetical protein
MSARRAGTILAAVLVLGGGVAIGLYVALFLEASPPPVQAAIVGPHQAALELQTVAEVGHGENPNWVSYYSRTPGHKWVHSTILRVPAHALVHVTIYQYDSATGLRNPIWGQPRGLVGNVMFVNGVPVKVLKPELTSHTFAIPELGVSVPLPGVSEEAKNTCSYAPCTLAEAHNTITFTFRTYGPHKYRWQCFVPCAAGFIFGFGGPMQSIGYMDGELEVQGS